MKSRFVKVKRTHIRKHRRSKYLPGAEEDTNRYVRCWNCGFVVDMKNITLISGSGVRVYDDPYEDTEVRGSGDAEKIVLGANSLDRELVMLEVGPDDASVTDYYTPRMSEAIAGCPLCGTTNLP